MCVCVCGWMDFYIIIAFLGEFTTSFVFFFNTKRKKKRKRVRGRL